MTSPTTSVPLELPPIDIPQPHRPRKVRFLGYHATADWTLKLYGVAAHGDVPRPVLVEAMRTEIDARLPSPATAELRHGVGFAIAHDAADLGFVLIDWWYGRNEIHQIVLSTKLDDPGRLAPHPLPAVGCVWELSVVDFERRAWLRHVLASADGQPSLEDYMAEQYNDDV